MSKDFVRVLRSIIQHVDELQKENDPTGNGFTREFRKIREEQQSDRKNDTYPAEEGKKPCNIRKNRYKDIIPYDYKRVELTTVSEEEGDYINASFIEDAYERNGYIASQGPLPHTVDDFWRMLWQYRIEIVFASCREWEDRKHKCHKYWASPDETLVFGNITVTLEKEVEVFADFYMRHLVAQKGGEVQRVTQFHYCGWPDHGIPENADHIREIIGYVRDYEHNPKIPVVIHCSAGCGRTGTICAIDYCWSLLKEERYPPTLTLYDVIKKFRQQRMSMVQTPDQYELAHLVLQALCERLLQDYEDHNYENHELPAFDAPPPPLGESQEETYYNISMEPMNAKKEEESVYEVLVESNSSSSLPRAPAAAAAATARVHPTPMGPKPVPAPRPAMQPPAKAPPPSSERSSGVGVTALTPKTQPAGNTEEAGVQVAKLGQANESLTKSVHRPHVAGPGKDPTHSYENFQGPLLTVSDSQKNSEASAPKPVKPEMAVSLGRVSGQMAAKMTKQPPFGSVSQATGRGMGQAITVISISKTGSTIVNLGSADRSGTSGYENASIENQNQQPPLPGKSQQNPHPAQMQQQKQHPSQTSGVAIQMLKPSAPSSKPPPKQKLVSTPPGNTTPPVSKAQPPQYFSLEPQNVYSLAQDMDPLAAAVAEERNEYATVEETSVYTEIPQEAVQKKETSKQGARKPMPKPRKNLPLLKVTSHPENVGSQSAECISHCQNDCLYAVTTEKPPRPMSTSSASGSSHNPLASAPVASNGPPELPRRNYTEDEISEISATSSVGRSPKQTRAPIPPASANSQGGLPSRSLGQRKGTPPRHPNTQPVVPSNSNSHNVTVLTGPGIFRQKEIGYKRRLGRVRNGERQAPQRWKKL